MVANKDRLYVTLYLRSEPGTYHWGITRSPKNEDPTDPSEMTRYHARNLPGPDGVYWEYERRDIRSRATHNTLVRILISKIDLKKVEKMEEMLANIELLQDDPSWNCKSWVETAVHALGKAGIIRDWKWSEVETKALWYVEKKFAEGRFETPKDEEDYDEEVPTFDMLADKEVQK